MSKGCCMCLKCSKVFVFSEKCRNQRQQVIFWSNTKIIVKKNINNKVNVRLDKSPQKKQTKVKNNKEIKWGKNIFDSFNLKHT